MTPARAVRDGEGSRTYRETPLLEPGHECWSGRGLKGRAELAPRPGSVEGHNMVVYMETRSRTPQPCHFGASGAGSVGRREFDGHWHRSDYGKHSRWPPEGRKELLPDYS